MFGSIFSKVFAPFRWLAKKRGGLPLFFITATFLIIYFLFASRTELVPVEVPEKVWPIDTVVAKYQAVQPKLKLFGEVVAGRSSELRALVAGPIVKVGATFREGGVIKRGDLLVQIDPFDYQAEVTEQKALLAEAKTHLEILKRDYDRTKELFDENNVSAQMLDNASLEVEQQVAVLTQREVASARAKRQLDQTRLIAPFDGVVSSVNADLGKQLSTNDKVADLIDTDRLEARFSLSNAQFGRIIESGEPLVGRSVQIAWHVGRENLRFEATIERVGAQIASSTGGVNVFAEIAAGGVGSANTLLRPGAFVWVEMPDRSFDKVLRAPESAIYGEDRIYIVKKDRLVERRIELLGFDDDHILFMAAGSEPINDGDLIVTTQLREAGTGVKVEVR